MRGTNDAHISVGVPQGTVDISGVRLIPTGTSFSKASTQHNEPSQPIRNRETSRRMGVTDDVRSTCTDMHALSVLLSDSMSHASSAISIPSSLHASRSDVLIEMGKIYDDDWRAMSVAVTSCSLRYGVSGVTSFGLGYASSSGDYQQEVIECSDAIQRLAHDARRACGEDDAKVTRFVHDWLVRNCEYDTEHMSDGGETGRTAWDALVRHRCVCEGYSRALHAVLLYCGIPSILIISDKMCHMWDMVKVDGKWYHVDVTYDDPVSPYGSVGTHGIIMRDCLLRSDEAITRLGHHGWRRDCGPFMTVKPVPQAVSDFHHGAIDEGEWH